MVLADPPSRAAWTTRPQPRTLRVVKTKKTELLFLALFLRLLEPGGRAAVIVPDGVLFGSSKAHVALRKILGGEAEAGCDREAPQRCLQAIRRSVYRDRLLHQDRKRAAPTTCGSTTSPPTASASTTSGPRCCRKTSSVSDRPRRSPRQTTPRTTFPTSWPAGRSASESETSRARTEQSFFVPKADIVAQNYDLSLNRYKEMVHEEVKYRPPLDIIADLERLESEIQSGLAELKTHARVINNSLSGATPSPFPTTGNGFLSVKLPPLRAISRNPRTIRTSTCRPK